MAIFDVMLLIIFLSSVIIEDIWLKCRANPTYAMAYFYFTDKERPEDLVRSMINQFSAQCKNTPDVLVKLYEQCRTDRRQPSAKDLMMALQLIIQGFERAYIVLDALDECAERMRLLDVAEEIISWKPERLHVLATSRRERVFMDRLEPRAAATFDIQNLIREDIRIYVHGRLSSQFATKTWLSKVQHTIENRLIEDADGM